MKCPYCGTSNVEKTNAIQEVVADIAGLVANIGALMINPNKAGARQVGFTVRRKLCSQEKYKCLNRWCGKTFTIERN